MLPDPLITPALSVYIWCKPAYAVPSYYISSWLGFVLQVLVETWISCWSSAVCVRDKWRSPNDGRNIQKLCLAFLILGVLLLTSWAQFQILDVKYVLNPKHMINPAALSFLPSICLGMCPTHHWDHGHIFPLRRISWYCPCSQTKGTLYFCTKRFTIYFIMRRKTFFFSR